jgi:hypothetical protein
MASALDSPAGSRDGSAHGPARGGPAAAAAARAAPLPSAGPPAFPKALSDAYRLGEELGRGAHGRVFRGLDTRTGEQVAVKQIALDRIPPGRLAAVEGEVDLLAALSHENVVRYVGSLRTRAHLYIVTELAEAGSLAAAVRPTRFGPFSEALAALAVRQVLAGLAYLHDQGVVHRDIKGANILATAAGAVKLADFGVAARLGAAGGADEGGAGGEAAAPAGTPYWMAPEVVELRAATPAADVWSVGCLAVELTTGAPPYAELQPLSALYNIVQDAHPPLPAGASARMRDFLLACFRKDPAERPSARALMAHPWVAHHRRALRDSWRRGARPAAAAGAAPEAAAVVGAMVEHAFEGGAGSGSDGEAPSPKSAAGDGGGAAAPPAGTAAASAARAAVEDAAARDEFAAAAAADPAGARLLEVFDAMGLGSPRAAAAPAPAKAEAEVRRQVASLRILAPPGERSLVEEAAAAASARALGGLVARGAAARAAFLAADGLSGVRELLDSPSERVLLPTLDLLLALVADGGAPLDAVAALGVVPAALRFAGPAHAPELRARAARFAGACARGGPRAAEALVACQGVPFMASLMDEAPRTAAQLELLAAAVAGLWALVRRAAAPPGRANALLRLTAHHGMPSRLVRALPWVLKAAADAGAPAEPAAPAPGAPPPPVASPAGLAALLDAMVNLFAAHAHGDAVVKARACQLATINPMFGHTTRMPPRLQVAVARAVRRLSADQATLAPLEAANALAYLAAQLPRADAPALQAEALLALRNLTQLSRARQEKAAAAGAVPWLCRLAAAPPAGGGGAGEGAGAAAVAVLCSLAHCSPAARAELWAHGALDVLLRLLGDEAAAPAALEALAAWLDAEAPRLEPRLLAGAALARLVALVPAAASSGDEERLPGVLRPLARIAGRSPRLAAALSGAGLAARATELLRRPAAPVALALLDLLRLLYEADPEPERFVAANRVASALQALADGAAAGEQVLVRKQAQALLDAFAAGVATY